MKKPRERKGGRKTTVTEEAIQKLEELFRVDATVPEACQQALIGVRSYYRRLKKDAKFRQRMEAAQTFPFILMKKVVLKAASNGDGKLALKWLRARQRERYYEKNDVGIEAQGNAFTELCESIAHPNHEDDDEEAGF